MTALLKYDAACHALAEAKSFDEVRDWEDKAAAVREYSRRINNRSLELDALEIRERARRRRGQLLIELKEDGKLVEGRPPEITVTDHGQFIPVRLDHLGISRNESSRDQRIAKIDGNSFERLVARCRSYAEDHPDKHTFDVLRAPGEAVNGARSIMGSRQEPDDSLDYFPTPPWATRALFEEVLPLFQPHGESLGSSIWEPACGEGHIAEVMREYGAEAVTATDIHDYGYNDHVFDFLKAAPMLEYRDWIITNPPFGDLTEKFVLRSLELAGRGVAMFVRLQWLESVGRYEAVFRDHPPTLICFFAERVNLCKGRWEPEGSTATAYIWLVWLKGAEPRAPFWIPPGQREKHTKPDDAERFTVHPVIKKQHPNAAAAQSTAAPEPARADQPSAPQPTVRAGSPFPEIAAFVDVTPPQAALAS